MTDQEKANAKEILIFKESGEEIKEFENFEDYKEDISPLGRHFYSLTIGQTFDGVKYIDYLAKTFKSKISYCLSANKRYVYVLIIEDK